MKIGILGAGTWGTALARLLSLNGHSVTVWSPIEAEARELAASRRHPKLAGMVIPDDILFNNDMSGAVGELTVFAVPSVYMRSTARAARELIAPGSVCVSVAKGIEADTFKTMTDIIEDEIPGAVTVALSGPTHAEEVALSLPTTIVSASRSPEAAAKVQRVFANGFMRVYTNADIFGVELCGAMKNIIALAAGISDGIGYGDNAKAAIITRGMAEIARLGRAMGADERTFYGLAGVGDLIVTATSRHSRNNRAGFLMGQGRSADEAVREVGMVVEGLNALPAAVGLAEKYGVELPITFAVNELVTKGGDPREMVARLMARQFRGE